METQKFTFEAQILKITLIVLAVAASLTTLTYDVIAESTESYSKLEATGLAFEKMESVMMHKSAYGFATITEENFPAEELQENEKKYERKVSVVEVNQKDLTTPQVGTGLKKIIVTVSWGDTPDDRIAISALIADY